MVNIIDLHLLEHSEEPKSAVYLNEAIEKNNLAVILGSPGSGKTSILKNYADRNDQAQFLKIKKFIKLDNQVKDDTKILLLDGLDEYRSISTDKTFVIDELSNKLKALNDIKIVISCREMDWYGESDKSALKDELGSDAVVFSVQLLNNEKQMEMANLHAVDNPKNFITKFSSYGFLDNPQMFKMIASLYMEKNEIDFNSKAELYEAFIKGAKEKNEERTLNTIQLTSDEILKYSGYLAFYYMFTDVESFEVDFIDKICDNDKGFSKDKLIQVLNTSLFDQKTFIHRTIAEFGLAHFLVNENMNRGDSHANERIKALFVKKGKIPTEVRGVYAWLCSLHGDMSFIDVDPYYQAVYGDNSLFTETQKREIVLSVKNYAKKHPRFIDYWGRRDVLDGLISLYTDTLDEFYIEQFEEAKSMKSHYKNFIVSILNTSDELSGKMQEYLKEKVFDIDVPEHIVYDIVGVLGEESNFLLNVWDSIKDGSIADNENSIKEFIFTRLYLNVIELSDIVEYLKLYKESNMLWHSLFLFKIDYTKKLDVVKLLQELQQEDKRENISSTSLEFIEDFIADFLYETILKYPDKMDENTIYDTIASVREGTEKYRHLKFKSYKWMSDDDAKEHEKVFQELSDKLYIIYLDNAIKKRKGEGSILNTMYDYQYFAPSRQTNRPMSELKVLIEKIKSISDLSIKKELFTLALSYLPHGYDEKIKEHVSEVKQLNKIAKGNNVLSEELEIKLNKDIPKWKVKENEKDREDKKKLKKILKKNKAYFSKKVDKEISTNFGDLRYISQLIYYSDKETEETHYLTNDIFSRLKSLLKNKITQQSIDESLTTLDSLSSLTDNRRYIEEVYYMSLTLNDFVDSVLFTKIDETLLKYLYIVDLKYGNHRDRKQSNCSKYLEKYEPDKAIKILKEYIHVLLKKHNENLVFLFDQHIRKDTTISKLKPIAMSQGSSDSYTSDYLLQNILRGYALDISIEELKNINKTLNKDSSNKITIDALIVLYKKEKSKFTKEMAIAMRNPYKKTTLFEDATPEKNVYILDCMYTVFNTEEYFRCNRVGMHDVTPEMETSKFLEDIIKTIDIEQLKSLSKLHNDEDDIWRDRILNEIDTREQQDADQNFERYPTTKLKQFILADAIVSKEDFFEDIKIKLNTIKQEIEGNRNNEKKLFYNENSSSKNEESCRDVILQKLNDKYGYDLDNTKEKHEADNRVDINIKYKANSSYEVQIECKKDRNRDLYKGIKNQLIEKYLSSAVEYGMYMIFYFGDKRDKQRMLAKIEQSVPDEYQDKIEIVCIDLTL